MTSEQENKQLDDFQVVPLQTSELSTYVKAEIDMQIATARAYPRSLTSFLKKVEGVATISPAVAESCTYALPRKEFNKATGKYEKKFIQGPSVRLAEIMVSSFGNIRSGARVISNDGRIITAQGVCHDLETNNLVTVEVQRRITTKEGKTFSEDMQVVTGNAACSIALRNAIFKVIPAALIAEVYERIQEVAKGDAATLVQRRDKALNYFRGHGITDAQIAEALEIKDVNDIDLERLQILSGFKQAIVNNESTLNEIFPPENAAKTKGDKANDKTEKEMKDLLKAAKDPAGQKQ